MRTRDRLTEYLRDLHALEELSMEQLLSAPAIADEPALADALREHLAETEEHERLVRELLEARDGDTSLVKDAIMRLGGEGFVLFADAQRDTPGKLAAHVLSYEALEWAAYHVLDQLAARVGDREVASVARYIRSQEEAMMRRIQELLDRTVTASLESRSDRTAEDLLGIYLRDAHALEAQSIQLLEDAGRIFGRHACPTVVIEHLSAERRHMAAVEECLGSLGHGPSRIKDATLRIVAKTWTAFLRPRRDRSVRHAIFLFAFQYLEIAGYEQLHRVATKIGATSTEKAIRRILLEERRTADRLAASFETSSGLAAAV